MQEDENPKDRHGKLFRKKTFSLSPPSVDDERPTKGLYDRLCVDGIGNVRAARWRDKRVVGFNKDGKIIVMIRAGDCKSPTIPCSGVRILHRPPLKEVVKQFPRNGSRPGDLFKVGCGSSSELREFLGERWKGAGR
nr:hypothetical protein L203_01678 [Cryptococcus depauperatus CBS 7841]